MDGKRPYGHGKHTGGGSVHVGRGGRASSGPVGNGGRGGFSGSGGSRSGGDRGGWGFLGLLGLFALLPKGLRRALILIVAAVAVLSLLRGGVDTGEAYEPQYAYETATARPTAAPVSATAIPVQGQARDKRVQLLGNGEDTVTVMVYMCGTDLESKYGMATADLQEMAKASLSEKVNLIVQTGGCKSWRNPVVSSRENQIYRVKNGDLERLESSFGAGYMTDPATLTSFIRYCTKNYPASRNILILWDHGGGSLSGYGYDENQRQSDTMTLPEISAALRDGGCTFDWIGFDACLMATLETALVCDSYGDYMIASEESEPGTGWQYTRWLSALSQNTSMSTEALGRIIVDDFVEASQAARQNAQVTLSVVDLATLSGTVPQALRNFSVSTNALMEGDGYRLVSDARAGVRQFSKSNRLNQVDLVDLADRIGTGEAQTLAAALRGAVIYNRATVSRAYGLSVYFPYETLSTMNSAVATYDSLGMDSEYTKCIQSFASLEQGGQLAAYGSQQGGSGDLFSSLLESYLGAGSSPYGAFGPGAAFSGSGTMDDASVFHLLSSFSGRSLPQSLSWVNADLVSKKAAQLTENRLDPRRITATNKGGKRFLVLNEAEWNLIDTAAVNLFVDDGEGYLDLGCDNYLIFDEEGDLSLEFDGTWLCLDGNPVAFYMTEATEQGTFGRVPVDLVRTEAGETWTAALNLQIHIDRQGNAQVLGAYPLYEGETPTEGKALMALQDGDIIRPLCDGYTYAGAYEGTFTLEDAAFTVSGPITVDYRAVDNRGLSISYRITDIYGAAYWTPAYTK